MRISKYTRNSAAMMLQAVASNDCTIHEAHDIFNILDLDAIDLANAALRDAQKRYPRIYVAAAEAEAMVRRGWSPG